MAVENLNEGSRGPLEGKGRTGPAFICTSILNALERVHSHREISNITKYVSYKYRIRLIIWQAIFENVYNYETLDRDPTHKKIEDSWVNLSV